MSEDAQETTNAQEQTSESKPVPTPAATKEEVSQEDLKALEQAIEDANKTLVTDDVQEQIKVAKEQARVEAEKEFAKNQKIKEMEEQLKKKEEENVAIQKQAADQLAALKARLDDMSASRAVAPTQTPFDKQPQEENKITPNNMTPEQMKEFERDSYLAFANRNILKN